MVSSGSAWSRVGVEHSDLGGRHWLLQGHVHTLTRVLRALIETGHHAGFRDCMAEPGSSPNETVFAYLKRPSLVARYARAVADGAGYIRVIDDALSQGSHGPPRADFEYSLLIRMAMAGLTEADRSDTAAFFDPEAGLDLREPTDWKILDHALTAHLTNLDREASASAKEFHAHRPLLAHRVQLLRDCIAACALERGMFRVTAPVGLGKTLSVMRFALGHAMHNITERRGLDVPMDRIIWVTPHIAVTSQVAAVFRGIFGDDEVLEHHSGAIDHHRAGTTGYVEARSRTRLMLQRENWHGPRIVVSTIHQLFESLMAATPSKLRKIRALRNAVIVIDEAQSLPTDFMQQITSDLNALVENWRASVVFCTATQPPLRPIPWKKFSGLRAATEIVRDPVEMFGGTHRVRMHLHDDLKPVQWPDLAATLAEHDSFLCIVNETKQARRLHEALLARDARPDDTYILTARICVAHRNALLAEIRTKLAAAVPVRVVSTSLIEAGVDIDFPVVFRALAGLDRIAQAIGRCNREWRTAWGTFVIFASQDAGRGARETAVQVTRGIIADVLAAGEPLDRIIEQTMFERFFSARDRAADLDAQGVFARMAGALPANRLPNLRTAGQKARLISDDTVTVLTPWGGGEAEARLRAALDPITGTIATEAAIFPLIQGQSVSLPRRVFSGLQERGGVEERLGGAVWLIRAGHYDPVYGTLPI